MPAFASAADWSALHACRTAALHCACTKKRIAFLSFLSRDDVKVLLLCLQVLTDNDMSTKFHWKRPSMLSPQSTATITWTIPDGTPPGTYRLRHFGDYKHVFGGTQSFSGASSSFSVGSSMAGRLGANAVSGWLRRLWSGIHSIL